ncbi:hypothetical protein BUALT_Bualt02G0133300 [Buddleja alternifolia]|uniref:Protein TIFY n=1 Tax=Buddleja alternifolia TaxID=168488 RepID=A0AAV6Y643_9LAMI|nr:hypothetical protein BUALT_Bualt02G0133300 [Buddleja alternifolia]
MERDFMGLSSTVKQEIHDDEPIDAAPVRSLAMQWSFPNNASAIPQLVSFRGSREDTTKTGFDSLASTGLVTITTTENFDSDHKSYQKNIVPEKQGAVRYTIHQPITSQANLTVLPTIGGAVHQSFLAATRQNLIGPSNPKPLAGVPVTNHGPVKPSTSPVVGTTDLRNGSKVSGAPAQLTLFYNGSVCVYDNISAEKAQAIMLLAGNGPPTKTSITPPPAPPVQASIPSRPSILESFTVSHPYNTTPHRSAPTIVTSISGSQYAGRSCTNNDTPIVKPGVAIRSSNNIEPRKVVNLPGFVSSSSTFVSSGTVPQFRRKSLARFLEKRKERVINSSPYTRQSPDSRIPGSGSTSLSVISSS